MLDYPLQANYSRSMCLCRSAGPLPVGNRHVVTFAGENDGPSTSGAPAGKPEEKELFGGFGYTRLDAIILGVALIALGYIMYYGKIDIIQTNLPCHPSQESLLSSRLCFLVSSEKRIEFSLVLTSELDGDLAMPKDPEAEWAPVCAGLQALGMDAGMAGNWVQLVIFLGICIGWVSTYLYRVATKNMTYVRQASSLSTDCASCTMDEESRLLLTHLRNVDIRLEDGIRTRTLSGRVFPPRHAASPGLPCAGRAHWV